MYLFFRAAGRAAALLTLAAMFASPSTAADAQATTAAIEATQSVVTFDVAVQKPRSLQDMVASYVDFGNADEEQLCLAKAVYFEARGESLEGQLAVAQVVLNRVASGVFPGTVCGVVTQRAQFSFIRGGKFPPVRTGDACWHKALAIADIARKKLANEISSDVLWYHASYVAPSWGRRLTRVAQIGAHIFYS